MRSISHATYLFCCSALLIESAIAFPLQRTLPAAELPADPAVIEFHLYETADQGQPVLVQQYSQGEFQAIRQGDQVRIQADASLDTGAEGLWLQLYVDGEPRGERVALAVSAPGVTFALGNHLDMDGNLVVNLATPVAPGDAATKAYVDNKAPVALAQDGSNCASGYPLGVDESGNVQGCTADATDDTVQLSELSELCQVEGQILKYVGGSWVCATDTVGTGDNLGNHTATANLNMSNQRIVGLAAPVDAADAATKGYVDTAVAGPSTLDCVNTSLTLFTIGANSANFFNNPSCPAGYTATTPYCWTAASGVYSQGSGYNVNTVGNPTFCAWQNTTGVNQTTYGGNICCRVP